MVVPFNDIIGAGTKYLSLETSHIIPGYVGDIYRDMWGYNAEHHEISTTLEIGHTSIIRPQIQASGEAMLWDGRAIDITTDQWQIGAINIPRNFWAFTVTQSWLERHQATLASKQAVMPNRDWVEIGTKIGRQALIEAANDRILAGNTRNNELVESGLLRASNIPVLEETEDLYALSPNAFYEKIVLYINNFCRAGNLHPKNVKLLYPSRMKPKFASKVSLDGTHVTETVAESLTKRIKLGNGQEMPMWLDGLYDHLELESELLEQLGINPPGTNKDRMMLFAKLPLDASPFATDTPSIWHAERVIDRTTVETVNFQECFVLFLMQSSVCFDHPNLARHYSFNKM